jgi:hypothetical protein
MKFPSKVDVWLAIPIWGALLLVIIVGFLSMFSANMNMQERVVLFLVHFALPCFLIWMLTTTCYIIDERNLVIQYGPFKKTVPLESIKRVRRTSNPLSSPALSLKRLEIVYSDHKTVLISPKDREEFMRMLQKRCPNAVVEI